MHLHLKRYAYGPGATLGRLRVDDETTLFTIERPWLGNKAFESCIPQGVYRCQRYSSAKYPDTFEVRGVPGRSKILIHTANWASDVQGCIGLGIEPMTDRFGVSKSRDAMAQFRALMRDVDAFDLLISQYQPEYP
ncbi:MAG: DUF5675 family protein [Motiliproteus sp.]